MRDYHVRVLPHQKLAKVHTRLNPETEPPKLKLNPETEPLKLNSERTVGIEFRVKFSSYRAKSEFILSLDICTDK